jgi:hypothetical protein
MKCWGSVYLSRGGVNLAERYRQYFLSELFDGTGNAGRRFPVSKLEKEHLGTASKSVTENSPEHDVVVYASLVTR